MAIGLGTAALGRPQYINVRLEPSEMNLKSFRAQSFSVLERAYELGVRYFDTAPGYGLAENLLLEWLNTKNDSSIQIATKWGYTYVANFNSNAKVHEIKEHSLEKLNEQWQISRAFLPNLKVYQIHSATLETGVLENRAILERMAFLKNEHQIEIGITVTGENQTEVIKKALDVSVNQEQLFDAFQVTYNILDQSLNAISKELIGQNKRIIIKEALANGRLFRNTSYDHYLKLYNVLEELAKNHNVGVDVIALKFCEQTIAKNMVLSGASNIVHLESNLKANTAVLSEDDIAMLKNFKIDTTKYWQERKQLIWN
ncbi:aldo/keto reductase [Maribacter sp. HTCC2170]|uniref:aldo/keto reductase n=1 Tax=Maribacter sp. (strain HTCC2170 / KCCM 42371) TaxID=313603 RepID=UPI00006BE0D8|nr:aldo/keto reductase [Maribacter sp. HTCC2170]EAR00009.1 putative oxidoreductase [Maribacter sp. HTCC2170]